MRKIFINLSWLLAILLFNNNLYSQYIKIQRSGYVMANPTQNGRVIGIVFKGMRVKKLDGKNGWLEIEIKKQSVIGWIEQKLTKKTKNIVMKKTKEIDKLFKTIVLLSSLYQYSLNGVNKFNLSNQRIEFSKNTLTIIRHKYSIGNIKGAFIMPPGSYLIFSDNMWKFSSKTAWIDPIKIIYEDRGTLPEFQIRNPNYQIILLQNGDPIQYDEQPVNGIKIIIQDSTQVKYKNKIWTYISGEWKKD